MNLLLDSDGTVMSMQKVVSEYPMFAVRNDGDQFADDQAVTFLRQRELEWSYGLIPFGSGLPGSTPEGRLLSIYDLLDDWFQRDDYEASVIISLVIEMAKLTPLPQNSVDYIALAHDLATSYATELQLTDPAEFSLSWRLLMKGTIFAAMEGDTGAAIRAKQMAHSLIRSYMPQSDYEFDFGLALDFDNASTEPASTRVLRSPATTDDEMSDYESAVDWLELGVVID